MEKKNPEPPRVQPFEVRYPGYKSPVREITSKSVDYARINKINNALDPAEYAETGSESISQTENWLANVRRTFKNLQPTVGKRNVVGVENATEIIVPEMIVGKASELGELSAYTYIYDHKSPIADKEPNPQGSIRKEISFVSDQTDDQRDPEEIAEAMQQTAMMLWESHSGKATEEFNGTFTPDQLNEAKTLQIFTTTGNGDNEIQYRDGLIKAGFTLLGVYEESGEPQRVYTLDIDRLVKIMDVKKAVASH